MILHSVLTVFIKATNIVLFKLLVSACPNDHPFNRPNAVIKVILFGRVFVIFVT